jgi:glycosyltransferase involved in cell wall biosynthesis
VSASVEIVFPVLNEEATLRQNVLAARAAIDRLVPAPQRVSLAVADNGSSDGTEAVGRALADSHGVRYLRLPRPGVGAALKLAWASSPATIVGYMDLDLATDLKHLPEAIHAIEEDGNAVCYGSRLHPRSVVVGRKVHRTLVSHAFNMMLRLYLGARFSDGMCGFKFLRRDTLEALARRGAVSDNWFFSTELLLAAQRLELPIRELPVEWTDDPDSRVRLVKLARQYIHAMRVFRARDMVELYQSAQTPMPSYETSPGGRPGRLL